jgi:hypothetical protein
MTCCSNILTFIGIVVVALLILDRNNNDVEILTIPKMNNTNVVISEPMIYKRRKIPDYSNTTDSDTKIFRWEYEPGKYYRFPVLEYNSEHVIHAHAFPKQVDFIGVAYTLKDLKNDSIPISWHSQFTIRGYSYPPQPFKKSMLALFLLVGAIKNNESENDIQKMLVALEKVSKRGDKTSLFESLRKIAELLKADLEAPKKGTDMYKHLGLDMNKRKEYSTKDITKAYRTMVSQVHPDKYTGKEQEEMAQRYSFANQAFEILKNVELKVKYDARLDSMK